jgi:diguanylate cyclase (GGDEF)-like protein
VRTADTLVRYGGDEFVALLEGAAGQHAYLPVVERMHQMLAEPFHLPDGNTISISASIGAADSTGPWRTPLELIDAADQAMYQAKRLQSETSRS